MSVRTTSTRRTTGGESLSVAQAAAEEGVSPDTIRRRIADGTLPAHRVGPRLIRIYAADLERLRRPIPTAAGGGSC